MVMDNQQGSLALHPIPSHKDYCVDDLGNIYSKKFNKLNLLKPHLHKARGNKKYLRIKVAGKLHLVHRLVASTIKGEALEQSEVVNHLDGNTCNNSRSNLEVISHKENVAHAVANSLYCQGDDWYKARNLQRLGSLKS